MGFSVFALVNERIRAAVTLRAQGYTFLCRLVAGRRESGSRTTSTAGPEAEAEEHAWAHRNSLRVEEVSLLARALQAYPATIAVLRTDGEQRAGRALKARKMLALVTTKPDTYKLSQAICAQRGRWRDYVQRRKEN